MKTPKHSDMDCNGNAVGSVCEFFCNVGFTRVGAASSTCIATSEGAKWSEEEPICRPGKTGKLTNTSKCFTQVLSFDFDHPQ